MLKFKCRSRSLLDVFPNSSWFAQMTPNSGKLTYIVETRFTYRIDLNRKYKTRIKNNTKITNFIGWGYFVTQVINREKFKKTISFVFLGQKLRTLFYQTWAMWIIQDKPSIKRLVQLLGYSNRGSSWFRVLRLNVNVLPNYLVLLPIYCQ